MYHTLNGHLQETHYHNHLTNTPENTVLNMRVETL